MKFVIKIMVSLMDCKTWYFSKLLVLLHKNVKIVFNDHLKINVIYWKQNIKQLLYVFILYHWKLSSEFKT